MLIRGSVFQGRGDAQNATDSEMLDNGILLRYKNEKIVSVTILDASTSSQKTKGIRLFYN